MSGSLVVVREALEKRLQLVPGIPAIAWENNFYDPVSQTPYVRSKLRVISNDPAGIGIGSPVRMDGLFLLDLFYPPEGGPRPAETLADSIIATFPRGLFLTESSNRIEVKSCVPYGGQEIGQWFQLPVTINWYAYFS